MSTYVCGYCGQPCDSKGVPLQEPLQEPTNENATLVHGECCRSEVTEERRVTHEMAMDAGDLSLEGRPV